MAGTRRITVALFLVWGASRSALLLCLLKVWVFPGPDVTGDVSVIYRGWYSDSRMRIEASESSCWA